MDFIKTMLTSSQPALSSALLGADAKLQDPQKQETSSSSNVMAPTSYYAKTLSTIRCRPLSSIQLRSRPKPQAAPTPEDSRREVDCAVTSSSSSSIDEPSKHTVPAQPAVANPHISPQQKPVTVSVTVEIPTPAVPLTLSAAQSDASSTPSNGSEGYADDPISEADDVQGRIGLCRSSDDLPPACPSFDDLRISENLLRGIYAYGFEYPSAVQQRAIPTILKAKGRDVVIQASSGTGKTAAYGIGVLGRLDWSAKARRQLQAMVLLPTRELAAQTARVLQELGTYASSDFVKTFVGGGRVGDDVQAAQSCMVAVGSTGRISDIIKRGALRVAQLKILVIDEADDMLSRGKRESLYDVFKYLPKDVLVVTSGTTYTDDTMRMIAKFTRSPFNVFESSSGTIATPEGIHHRVVKHVQEEHKLETLQDLLLGFGMRSQCIIFAKNRNRIDWIAETINKSNTDGIVVSFLHADMARGERDLVLKSFRSGSARILVTGDLLSRGIDVPSCKVVINYDIPANADTYIHRAGRCGRFGRKGLVITFVADAEEPLLGDLQRHLQGVDFSELGIDEIESV